MVFMVILLRLYGQLKEIYYKCSYVLVLVLFYSKIEYCVNLYTNLSPLFLGSCFKLFKSLSTIWKLQEFRIFVNTQSLFLKVTDSNCLHCVLQIKTQFMESAIVRCFLYEDVFIYYNKLQLLCESTVMLSTTSYTKACQAVGPF